MQSNIYSAVAALLKCGSTLTPRKRREIEEAVKNHGIPKEKDAPSIISSKATASLLNRTVRSVDELAKQGILEPVKLPGRQRACGLRRAVGGDVTWLSRLGVQEPCGARLAGSHRCKNSDVLNYLMSEACADRVREIHKDRILREDQNRREKEGLQ